LHRGFSFALEFDVRIEGVPAAKDPVEIEIRPLILMGSIDKLSPPFTERLTNKVVYNGFGLVASSCDRVGCRARPIVTS